MTAAEKKHPITLETVVFTKSFVQTVVGHVPSESRAVSINPENNINVSRLAGSAGTYSATMTSVFNPAMDQASPYYFDMECMALFSADETLAEDEALRGVTITAHNVLYGAIREAVAWLSGRQLYGPLILGLSVLTSPKKAEPAEEPQEQP